MAAVLICAADPLTDELHGTLLWRQEIERHVATHYAHALTIAVAARPDLVVVDRDLPAAERLVRSLRSDPTTRAVSIAVMARGPHDDSELRLLEAGANAVLRLPAGPEWDERLAPLLSVAPRQTARLPVRLEFEGQGGLTVESFAASVLNLSESGMLIETMAPLAVGTDVDFRFRLSGGEEPVCGYGAVVREAGAKRYGVRFYGLEGDGRERVRAFVVRDSTRDERE